MTAPPPYDIEFDQSLQDEADRWFPTVEWGKWGPNSYRERSFAIEGYKAGRKRSLLASEGEGADPALVGLRPFKPAARSCPSGFDPGEGRRR